MLLHYFEKGNKGDQVVLFIHGSASDASVWLKELSIVAAKGYHCIAVDLRGHGETKEKAQPKEHVKLDLDTHLHDVEETLIHHGILRATATTVAEEASVPENPVDDYKEGLTQKTKDQQIIIVTHSFGGIVATNLALRYPKLVEKLVMACLPTKLILPMRAFLYFLLGKPLEIIQNNLDIFGDAPIRSRYKSSITTNAHVLQEIFKHVKNWNAFQKVPELKCPAHFAAGRFDFVAPAQSLKSLHKRIPGSSYELFKWSSHALMEDEPEKFEKWLLDCIVN